MRRLRATEPIRNLVRETRLEPSQFILPLFVCPGEGIRRPISAMPGNCQMSIDEMVKECAEIKSLGFSMALAVLIDATIVRGVLGPAFMRVMGRANWWAPAWVQRAVARLGLYEGGTALGPMAAADTEAAAATGPA
jgi:delta-aminolevulinic acid dehydratase/porphobilinogen synthase